VILPLYWYRRKSPRWDGISRATKCRDRSVCDGLLSAPTSLYAVAMASSRSTDKEILYSVRCFPFREQEMGWLLSSARIVEAWYWLTEN